MLAALDLASGKLFYRIRPRKRAVEFLELLKALRVRWPGEKLYVVCDNFSPHHHATVKAWCATNQVELVFLPTYGSWLNWIEAEFAALRRGTNEWLAAAAAGKFDELWSTARGTPEATRARLAEFPKATWKQPVFLSAVKGPKEACVMLAGCCTSVSASPRLTARVTSSSRFMKARPASRPPFSSNEMSPPGRTICFFASTYCGNDLSPG